MTQKHTPTPWAEDNNDYGVITADCGGDPICDMYTGHRLPAEWTANAAFIVHCVNNSHKIDAHDELVAVIEALGEFGNGGFFNKSLLDAEWCERAKCALAKARGEA